MTIEVLLSVMHQTDHSILDKMNVQSDMIVVNQCDRNETEEFEYNGYKIKWLSVNERGVGLSRNTALMRSTADILVFADDDVFYYNNFKNTILNAFQTCQDADCITFNFKSLNPLRQGQIIKKKHRIRWYNCLKYGTYRIAVKRGQIYKKNIYFSLLFGGGAKYQAGEDCHFLHQCVKKKLKCYSLPDYLGTVEQSTSTWFKGFDEKFYKDRGALFGAIYENKTMAKLMLTLIEVKKFKNVMRFASNFKNSLKGLKEFFNK